MSLGYTVLFQGAESIGSVIILDYPSFSFTFSEYIVPDVSSLKYEQPPSINENRNFATCWVTFGF